MEEPTPSRGNGKCQALVWSLVFTSIVIIAIIYVQILSQILKREIISIGTIDSWVTHFYLGLLYIYAISKESIRWFTRKSSDRLGEIFVYIITGTTITAIILSVTIGIEIPSLLKTIAIPVITTFAGTEVSKRVFVSRIATSISTVKKTEKTKGA